MMLWVENGREMEGRAMQYIVIDLEFTAVDSKKHDLKNEIIEIGAVRLNDKLEYVDSFDQFVHPEYGFVNQEIFKLTHIGSSNLENAPKFEEALKLFAEWIGNEPFRIYQWSDNDKKQVIRECQYKEIEEKFISLTSKYWWDIQRTFGRVMRGSKCTALNDAMQMLSLSFEGEMHRACDDAWNTARILQLLKGPDARKKIVEPARAAMTVKKSGSTIGDLLGLDWSSVLDI